MSLGRTNKQTPSDKWEAEQSLGLAKLWAAAAQQQPQVQH